MDQQPKSVVVIGASAGGINAIKEVMAGLEQSLDMSVLIVLHLSGKSISDLLLERLKRISPLKCKLAEDNEELKRGAIYIAPVDRHLLISEGKIVLGKGPADNRWRPSIDVLFRSAAVAYGPRAI